MNNKYYKNSIQFSMRDFISKIITRYIEWIEENEPEKLVDVQEVFQGFQIWLFRQTQD